MILVDPSCDIIRDDHTIQSSLDNIELAARICYASTKKKEEQKSFLRGLYNNHHYRPFEFGTIYFTSSSIKENQLFNMIVSSHWTRCIEKESTKYYTTNCRVIIESIEATSTKEENIFDIFWDIIQDIYDYHPEHRERTTIIWRIARGIADEFRTHTQISSLMQSTRYCRYSTNKFNNSIRICRPSWMREEESDQSHDDKVNLFVQSWTKDEKHYNKAISLGMRAEQARGLLPLDLYTEMIQCGFEEDWNRFFDQRLFDKTGKAHPDAKYISKQAYEKMK